MDFSDLFNLSDNDYAVDILTRVFGGVVEFVFGEGGGFDRWNAAHRPDFDLQHCVPFTCSDRRQLYDLHAYFRHRR